MRISVLDDKVDIIAEKNRQTLFKMEDLLKEMKEQINTWKAQMKEMDAKIELVARATMKLAKKQKRSKFSDGDKSTAKNL